MAKTREQTTQNKSLFYVLIAALILIALLAVFFITRPKQSTGEADVERASTALSMKAEKGTSTLEINRAKPAGTRPQNIEKDSWTVFVYMCGSDLESGSAAASMDLDEMIKGNGSNNIRFVVEAGGTKTWHNNIMNTNELGRYVIQGGNISKAASVSSANMGDVNTFFDFLNWGITNYPADHMALIFWDHGGGSVSGICFDERYNMDSLSLREVDSALNAANALLWDKFEFIGFDACLMSTLEVANILASYGDYMIASQESEPGTGWEYSSIVKWLSQNPTADGNAFGRALCDSYLASLDNSTKGFATLSVVDLSKIDQLMQDFYTFSQEMYESANNQSTLAQMTRNIQQADNYGSNNRREGFTNMVDLGGLVAACADATPSAEKVQQSLYRAITYQIRGNYHAEATGLSTFYPLQINSKQELAAYQTIAVNPSYLAYIDRIATGATYNGGSQYQQYSSDSIWQGNLWEWITGNTYTTQQQQIDPHWDYVDDHQLTSNQISFANEPQLDDEGTFWFQFDQSGIDNASVVSGFIYQYAENGTDVMALGETYDVYGDWQTGEFADGFDGKWLSLPDGQNLNLSVVSYTDDYIIYTSPIELNGTECYLRMRQSYADGSIEVEGAWSGVSPEGAVDRNIVAIKRGDVILPLYKAISIAEQAPVNDYEGNEYTVTDDTLTIIYDDLSLGNYLYSFCIQDVFGDCFYTAAAQFEVADDGNIYF